MFEALAVERVVCDVGVVAVDGLVLAEGLWVDEVDEDFEVLVVALLVETGDGGAEEEEVGRAHELVLADDVGVELAGLGQGGEGREWRGEREREGGREEKKERERRRREVKGEEGNKDKQCKEEAKGGLRERGS